MVGTNYIDSGIQVGDELSAVATGAEFTLAGSHPDEFVLTRDEETGNTNIKSLVSAPCSDTADVQVNGETVFRVKVY